MKGPHRRRSVLLAGGLDFARNHPRYGRELTWWAKNLGAAGFECWLCLGEGRAPLGGATPSRFTSARRADVMDALSWLGEIGEGDLGLLVASNHGDRSGLCLWGPDILSPAEFGASIGETKATLALVMGQCNGGVFGTLAGPRTVVLSACSEDERSWACSYPPGPAYNEFLYQLGTAFFGAPDDAPQRGPSQGPITLEDAFQWARLMDRQKESPRLFDPTGLAKGIVIGRS